jgi:hypothetical protein
LGITGASVTSPETNLLREKGNIASYLSGTITRNSPLVPLTSYTLQFQVNGSGSYFDIGSSVSITGSPAPIGVTLHNPTAYLSANSINYRVRVLDLFNGATGSISTVNLRNYIFYGPSSGVPVSSSDVRSLTNRMFVTGSNPFILNTGNTLKNFTAAFPSPTTITSVIDKTALNSPLTSNYINNPFNVNDAGGSATSYNVYTYTIAVTYDVNHEHEITRS